MKPLPDDLRKNLLHFVLLILGADAAGSTDLNKLIDKVWLETEEEDLDEVTKRICTLALDAIYGKGTGQEYLEEAADLLEELGWPGKIA